MKESPDFIDEIERFARDPQDATVPDQQTLSIELATILATQPTGPKNRLYVSGIDR